jgi:hypothetical protein
MQILYTEINDPFPLCRSLKIWASIDRKAMWHIRLLDAVGLGVFPSKPKWAPNVYLTVGFEPFDKSRFYRTSTVIFLLLFIIFIIVTISFHCRLA